MNPAPPVTSARTGQVPLGMRSPSTTVPDAVTTPAPITDTERIEHRCPMVAPGPTMDPSTVALAATRAPGSSTESDHGGPALNHGAVPDDRLLDDGTGGHE